MSLIRESDRKPWPVDEHLILLPHALDKDIASIKKLAESLPDGQPITITSKAWKAIEGSLERRGGFVAQNSRERYSGLAWKTHHLVAR